MLDFSACSPDISTQEKSPIRMSLYYQSILLSLQSNDKSAENYHPSQCKITVTLHRLSGALLSICTLRSSLNVFFFLLLLSCFHCNVFTRSRRRWSQREVKRIWMRWEKCQLLLHYRERTAMHPSLDNSCATITESSAVNLNAAMAMRTYWES